MKKSLLTILALTSISLLTGCFDSSNSKASASTAPTSQMTSPTDSTKKDTGTKTDSTVKPDTTTTSTTPTTDTTTPVAKKASVKTVYNLVTDGTLNVKEGDEVDAGDVSIVLTFTEASTAAGYDLYVNNTVISMTKASDSLSYSGNYNAKENEELTIAVIKHETASTDEATTNIVTFEQGEHYKLIGLTSGDRYFTGYDEEGEDIYLSFAVIAEDGYKAKVKVDGRSYESRSDGVSYRLYNLTSDTTITIETDKMETHSITYIGATAENHVDLTKSVLPTSFMGGSKVNFKFFATDGYSISDVEFSDNDGYSYDEYSDYTIALPNEDITVTITTAGKVTLRAQANEHIKSVKFYASLSWGSDTVTPSNEITEFVPDENEEFYTVVETDTGYKPSGIKGSIDEGAYGYNVGTTSDGKYVLKTYLYSDCDLIISLSSKRTVSLDSSCTGVDIMLPSDKTEYFQGDKVEFNLALNDSSNTKIGEVTYTYKDSEGDTEEDTIYPDEYEDYMYSFTMPDANVTIHVEVISVVKKTLSYTNSASTYVKSLFISGVSSEVDLDNDTKTSTDFEQGETVNIRINPTDDHTKTIKATFTDVNGNVTNLNLTVDYNSNQYTASFTLEESGTIAIVEGDAATKRTVTTNNDSIIRFYNSSKVNVESLGDLYDMDVIYFAIDDDNAPSGKSLKLSVTVNGEDYYLSTFQMDDYWDAYRIVVHGDVTIKAEYVEAVKIRFDDTTDYFDAEYDTVIYDLSRNPIDVSSGFIEKGTSFYFDGSDGGYAATSVTIGGVETKGTWNNTVYNYVFEATADIVIEVGWIEE